MRRLLLIAVVWIAGSVSYAQGWNEYLRVSFVDVGQRDAILIQTPGTPGKAVLIDGGPDKSAKNRLPGYLAAYGLPAGSVLDYVVLTHPHDDHFNGLFEILDDYQVRTIIDPGMPGSSSYNDFVDAAEGETADGKPATYIRLRQQPTVTLDWGDDVEAEILWADRADAQGLGSDGTRANNASVVIRMTFGEFSFLFTGDAEGKARNQPETTTRMLERLLLDTVAPKLRSTVLKVGHHGSETSSTLAFIRAVQPRIVVVQSGRRSFGGTRLPDQAVLDRYVRELPGVEILRTDYLDADEGRSASNDEDGDDVFMYTDGTTLRAYQLRMTADQRREWVPLKRLP